ncbi:LysR family transcriptional regulator [Marinivivus vitaminiproducens]|uniref:LysR family transcriptional regulator n=1 Tax=Marinivivus vitaminiproducens TaxID=3035935 RepID=UPI00279AC484|nr:LysR family transcriptional regulator [Geminicoccaceae bacterium SCSIO 64248]
MKVPDMQEEKSMDVGKLRTFMQVAELGSLTKAADRLHTAQPALSRQIRLLEEELGVPLFDRHGRGMVLNVTGQELAERAGPLLRYLEEMRHELAAKSGNVYGRVVVGLPPTLGETFGTRLLNLMLEHHPNIRVCVVTGLSGHLFDWLQRGELDASFLYSPPSTENLITDFIHREHLCLAGRPSELLAQDEQPVDFRRLLDLPLVIPAPKHGLRLLLNSAATAAGRELDIKVEVDSLRIQLELVMQRSLFTIMSRRVVEQLTPNGQVIAWDIANPAITRDLVLAIPAGHPSKGAVAQFRQIARDFFTEQLASS